jgi:bifunctional non-homologous end joining protein LigD
MSGRMGDGRVGVHRVEVDGRVVRLTHLDRVLWPSTGFTKGAMLDYYARIAPAILPHLRRRPLTMWRYPEGVEAKGWWQNECRGAPGWVPVYEYDAADGRHHRHCVVDDVATLLWVANQGTIELHPFLFVAEHPRRAPVVVFDLDPGAPATLADACAVGLRVRELLDRVGLTSFTKSSGGTGLHVVVPLNEPHSFEETKAFARTFAGLLSREGDDVIDRQTRSLRRGKVLLDWLQNDAFRSTVAPYSLRATPEPTVSMPVSWAEVERAAHGETAALLPGPEDALRRVERDGDLFADVLTLRQRLPGSEPATGDAAS